MTGAAGAAEAAGGALPAITGTESLDAYLRPVRRLLADEVTEVCINRPGEAWTESTAGWQRHELPELSFQHLRQLATLTAHSAGQGISEAAPLVSVALPTGERVQVIVPPAVESDTVSFTIRKPSQVRYSMDDYSDAGFFDDVVIERPGLLEHEVQLLELLHARRFREFFLLAVRSRQTMLVSGATGSGKTTFMKTLVDAVPPQERIITIEDTPELTIHNQPNHVRLFYSKGDRGKASLSAGDLVQASMRMKPDRLFPAELRDAAAYHFLMAANTGHPGSISSIHANNEQEALPRMAYLAAEATAASTTSHEALLKRIVQTIDVVVHIGRVGGKRRVTGIRYDPERNLAAANRAPAASRPRE